MVSFAVFVFYMAQRTRLSTEACVKITVFLSVTRAVFVGGRRLTEECFKLCPPLPPRDGGMHPIAVTKEKGIILAGHSTAKFPI